MVRRGQEEKEPSSIEVTFVDGPKAGEKLRLANPPPRMVRLAFPEWCTYEQVGDTPDYKYIGDVKIDKGIQL